MSMFLKMTLSPEVHILSFVALRSASLRGTKSQARLNVRVEEMWELLENKERGVSLYQATWIEVAHR